MLSNAEATVEEVDAATENLTAALASLQLAAKQTPVSSLLALATLSGLAIFGLKMKGLKK